MEPVSIFVAYSHQDEALRDEVETHLALLKRSNRATVFYDRRILPGQDWTAVLDEQLYDADIILLLVSPDFLASDYCYGVELQTAIELHDAGQAVALPVILRPCEWQEERSLASLQALPRDAKPVTQWSNRDEALLDVARGVRQVVESLEPKGPALHSIMEWSPSALVGARYNRLLSGPLPRAPSSIILVMPDQAILGESLTAAIVLTGADGQPAAGVAVKLELIGGRFGAAIGVPEPPPGQPVYVISGDSGGILVKIYPDEVEVHLIVEAEGFGQFAGQFVAGPAPQVYPWAAQR